MALRKIFAQVKPVTCKRDERIDVLCTKPGLAMTPSQVKELTDKGIAVSLPNEKQFFDGQNPRQSDWHVDPIFKRSVDMCEVWELEKTSQNKLLKAQRVDKKKFGL